MTDRTYKHWSLADDAELVLMREAKVPTKEIAKTLNRTPSSVVNRIYQNEIPYGIVGKKVSIEDIAVEFGEPDGRDEIIATVEERARAYIATEPKRSWFKRWFGW